MNNEFMNMANEISETFKKVWETHPAPPMEIPERDTSDLIATPKWVRPDVSDLIEAPKVDWLNVALFWTTVGFIGYLVATRYFGV